MKTITKKTLFTTCAALMAVALLAGCGATQAATPAEPETAPAEETEADVEIMPGIANPWTESTKEEFEAATGVQVMLPTDAADVVYRRGSEGLCEVLYVSDDASCCYRAQKTEALNDISGLHYRWDTTEETTYEGHAATRYAVETEEESVELYSWYDESTGTSQSVSFIR